MAAAAKEAAPMEAAKETAPMEAADLDWSTCPKGILEKISEKTDILFDRARFRSVCVHWWRSSSTPIQRRYQPLKFPILKLRSPPDEVDSINKGTNPFCYISKLNVVLVKPPPPPPQEKQTLHPWLMGICQTSTDKTFLCHPLANKVSPESFPHVLDFNKLSTLNLGCNFIKDDDLVSHPHPVGYNAPVKLAVVKSHGGKNLLLGTFNYNYSTPRSLLKCGDDDWKLMSEDLPISIVSGDMRHFKGRSYAVDGTGRTVIFEPDSSYHLMSESFVGGGGRVKFLVENDGELLLADVYECKGVKSGQHDPVKIDFFKLDEYEKKWVKWTNLKDRVLFLGMLGSFSVSASDLCVSKGNCVIFMDIVLEQFPGLPHMIFVFDLDESRVTPLSPEYSNLFWPPPSWIVNNN